MRVASLSLVLLSMIFAGCAGGDEGVDSSGASASWPTEPEPTDLPLVVFQTGEIPNPYHEVFRRPNWTAHPSTYIPGYPEDAQPLNLTLNATSREAAVEADWPKWLSLVPDVTYYIPGTAFVSWKVKANMTTNPPYQDAIRYSPHGTGVFGQVALAGGDRVALASYHDFADVWVGHGTEVPWIDVMSVSGSLPPVAPGMSGSAEVHTFTVEQGNLFFAAVENNAVGLCVPVNYPCPMNGAPWISTVGQIDPANGLVSGQGPFDVSARPRPCPEAEAFNGTYRCRGSSFSAPQVAGYAARIITELRSEWGWNDCGRDLACAPPGMSVVYGGALADGRLNREELLDALYRTAVPNQRGLWNLTGGEAYTRDEGWGRVDEETAKLAFAYLRGEHEPTTDPEVEFWWRFHQDVRAAYWEPWPPVWEASCVPPHMTMFCG